MTPSRRFSSGFIAPHSRRHVRAEAPQRRCRERQEGAGEAHGLAFRSRGQGGARTRRRSCSSFQSRPLPAGESCWLNLVDIQLIQSTRSVVYPSLRTTSSARRRYESNDHDNPRCAPLCLYPMLSVAQPSTRAPPLRVPFAAHALLHRMPQPLCPAGPLPKHARTHVIPSRPSHCGCTRFRFGPATPGGKRDDVWIYQYVLIKSISTVPSSSSPASVLAFDFRVGRSEPRAPAPSHRHPLP